jgi:hypothetical protein
MMCHRTRPVHLVVDGLPAHKTKLVKDYLVMHIPQPVLAGAFGPDHA